MSFCRPKWGRAGTVCNNNLAVGLGYRLLIAVSAPASARRQHRLGDKMKGTRFSQAKSKRYHMMAFPPLYHRINSRVSLEYGTVGGSRRVLAPITRTCVLLGSTQTFGQQANDQTAMGAKTAYHGRSFRSRPRIMHTSASLSFPGRCCGFFYHPEI